MKALVTSDGLSATSQPIPREAEVLGTPSGVFSALFSLESPTATSAIQDLHDLAGGDVSGTKAPTDRLTAIDAKPQSPASGTAPRPADLGEQSRATASRFTALADEQAIVAEAYAHRPEGKAVTAPQKLAFPEVEPTGSEATLGTGMPAPIPASILSPAIIPLRNQAEGEATQALVAVGPFYTGQTAALDPLTTQTGAPAVASGPEAFVRATALDAQKDAQHSLPPPQNDEVAKTSAAMPRRSTLAAAAIGATTDARPDALAATVATMQRSASDAERAPRPHAEAAIDSTQRIPVANAPAAQTPAHLPAPPSMQASPPATSDGAISALQSSAALGVEVRAYANKFDAPMAAPPDGLNTAQVFRPNTALRSSSLAADAVQFTGVPARFPGRISPESAATGASVHPFAAQRSVTSVSGAAEAEPKTARRGAIRVAGAPAEASIRAAVVTAAAVPPGTPVSKMATALAQQPDSVTATDPARPALSNIAATNQSPDDRTQAILSGASAAPKTPQTAREALFSLDDAGLNDPTPQTDAAQSSPSRTAYERAPVGGTHMAATQTAEQGAAVIRQIAESVARGIDHRVELTLAPEELGRVRLTLVTTEQGVTVSVQADRPDTLDLIRRNIDHLARDFRDLGYSAINFNFGEKPQDRGQPEPQGPLAEPNADDPHNHLRPTPRAAAQLYVVSGGLDLRL